MSIDVSATTVWTEVLHRIEGHLNKPTLESFLKVIRPIGLQGDTFVLAVPNRFARDWIEQRLLGTVRGALSAVIGREIQVQIVVTEVPPPQA
ncbi:MAG TPA: DnaA N-terminal domain-containing protein, partial [bacterium]|nr:DnaA N-terminal domain-containing protein [bacterium]